LHRTQANARFSGDESPPCFPADDVIYLVRCKRIVAVEQAKLATPRRGSCKFHKIKVEAFRVVNDERENFKVLAREGWR
jgi:hypothetical protein